ncbi:MAG: aldehyde dehydrogenase (NADP(+)) [Planctomycetota bacterium]|nr:aldehyde dehydrogenase (NADP(+)) [Planctomycetota bacterium]MDG1985562.1 aldehyde dehydrogenase (NADP(+)) [Planctomycetota bacterium]
MTTHQVLIAGHWRDADASRTFQAQDPSSGATLAPRFPTSRWSDCSAALDAATAAFEALRTVTPDAIADFLDGYAARIEAHSDAICAAAHAETALPLAPRLSAGELPRTTGQLRQAAAAARSSDWSRPVIDTAANIRTQFSGVGPVAVFGPNNFPLAFGSVSGGDFAAAIAAGNPVLAKAHPLHPETTRLLAREALGAALDAGLPAATVQLIYDLEYADGERLVQDPRLAAVAFTGSKRGGLALKRAADAAGTAIYLELGSVNPVAVLPGALSERGGEIATELAGSCLMGTGQFCTNPGLVLLEQGADADAFVAALTEAFEAAPNGTLFSAAGREGLAAQVNALRSAGAEVLAGGEPVEGAAACYANTVLRAEGAAFLANPGQLQTEAFGNATLVVVTESVTQTVEVIRSLEGNLTGCIYSAKDGGDDLAYRSIEPPLRQRVGRLLNDQMPTGVAVSPAMNHGGPFPATAHPGFSAVGVPGSMGRFAMLQCYDQVRPDRLPEGLRDENPRQTWRCIDGRWTQDSLS